MDITVAPQIISVCGLMKGVHDTTVSLIEAGILLRVVVIKPRCLSGGEGEHWIMRMWKRVCDKLYGDICCYSEMKVISRLCE